MKKVVDLKEYRQNKKVKEWIEKLDQFADAHYNNMTPEEAKGYRNFMRLIKAIEKKGSEEQETTE